MGRRQRLCLGRRRHLFADRRHDRAAAPRVPDRKPAAAAGWDSVDTLAVNLTESGGTLAGTSQAAAQAGATLSLVDSEFLAYEIGDADDRQRLQSDWPRARSRGLVADRTFDRRAVRAARRRRGPLQSAGQFRGSNALFQISELQHLWGRRRRSIDLHRLHLRGAAPRQSPHPIAAQLETGFPLDLGQVDAAPTVSDDFGQVSADPVVDAIDLGAVTVTVIHPIAAQLLSGTPLDLGLTTGAVSISDDFGSTNDAVVDVINLGTVP